MDDSGMFHGDSGVSGVFERFSGGFMSDPGVLNAFQGRSWEFHGCYMEFEVSGAFQDFMGFKDVPGDYL